MLKGASYRMIDLPYSLALLAVFGLSEVEGWKTHAQVLNTCAREDRRHTWFQGIRLLKGTRD